VPGEGSRRAPGTIEVDRPAVHQDLYRYFVERGGSLTELTWMQHTYHESRRWSAVEMLCAIDVERVARADLDKAYIWNAARAELTTKPGADRLARLADKECRAWAGRNPALSAVMQACGTWSRYWNEEEAHHEVVFNELAYLVGTPPIENEVFIEFRKIFPDDDMLRTLFLLACSEILAAVNYGHGAKHAADPGLAALFKQVAADEVQHMCYFVAFAEALVASGEYPAKNAFAVAQLFLRENGELQGSARAQIERRDTHVNWWDHLVLTENERLNLDNQAKKQEMIFAALRQVTGVEVRSVEAVEETWMELVG